MRVVHIAARPDADLDHVGSGFDELPCAVGGHHVAGDDLRVGQLGPDRLDRLQGAGLVAVGRVDDEHVGTEGRELLGPAPPGHH